MRLTRGAICGALVALAGCSGQGGDPVANNVPIAYAQRVNTIDLNPLSGAPSAPGGDLMVRDLSSASAYEHNVTTAITQGAGDVADPETSYDGKRIAFAMRCPTTNTSTVGGVPACTGHWNIWEYDTSTGGLASGTLRRVTSSTQDDDVHPAYLPAGGGFVFSSNRQAGSYANQALGRAYYALDEYERERVFNLHTMDAQGGHIQQISFNQSHDRNPVVRSDGYLMFSRWDHVGDRNRFTVFTVKPDGSKMFVLFGAHSDGNSFLHPREMDPAGRYAGYVVTDLMPLTRTHEGGALMLLDVPHYAEQNTPVATGIAATGGETQMTAQALNFGTGPSRYGRVSTPYPLWDGTDRLLVSYAPCELATGGAVVSCATVGAAELAALADPNRLVGAAQADPVQDTVPPSYAVYMFDPGNQSWRIVAAPPPGYMNVHPVALMARQEPAVVPPFAPAPGLPPGTALLDVLSVYDTDGLGRMGDPVLAPWDLTPSCAAAQLPSPTPSPIAKIAGTPPDPRPWVADLGSIRNPATAGYGCAPARLVRIVRAVAPPEGTIGLRTAIGQTNFEPQQILGYAVVEPDGSFQIQIPADTPIALSVIDAEGRAFQTHTNWIQGRPGEHVTCAGCHAPRRGGALNTPPVTSSTPAGWVASLGQAHAASETMAETRTRVNPGVLVPFADLLYADVWADTSQPGISARAPIAIRYVGNTNPANDLATAVPSNGIINYPDHVQPLWDRPRGVQGAATCTTCHKDPATLDLQSTIAGTGRQTSYEQLMVGRPQVDPTTGQVLTQVQDGVLTVLLGPALVNSSGSESDATGMARKSRLMEILAGERLMSSAADQSAHPNPPASTIDHSVLLNPAEKRLLAEWMDTGGKYYNDPFASGSTVRSIASLDPGVFQSQVFPILRRTCSAYCHQGVGSSATPAGSSFLDNRYVLTGDVTADYNATLTMISDVCHPASNLLLQRPSTIPHPAGAVGQLVAVLPATGPDYATIAGWIQSGCLP